MNKIEEKLLFDFKKSNKKRRLQVANKFGFANAEEYLAYLEGKPYPEENVPKPAKKVVIHNVIISDASGSMDGNKYENTKKGIEKEIKMLKSTSETTILHSLFEFVDSFRQLYIPYINVENPPLIPNFYGARGSNTPLWWAIIEVLNQFKDVPKDEKVLVKIFTDGGNNTMNEYKQECANLIKTLNSENFTITFVATDEDMPKIIQDMMLDESNTLTIENSGKGFERAYEVSLDATMTYTANVVKGEDVRYGFYKKIIK